MTRFGVFLAVMGLGSAGLHAFTDFQFRWLMWADPYQPVLGILVGLAGLALVIVPTVLANRNQPVTTQLPQPVQQPETPQGS